MVKSLTQTECLAYYTSIKQKQNINFESMNIRKNQLLHWIWKIFNQLKAIEMVKSSTQTEFLPYYTVMQRKQIIIE